MQTPPILHLLGVCIILILIISGAPRAQAGINTSSYDVRITNISAGAYPGESMAKGDVNNDGYEDVLLSAAYYGTGNDDGAALLFYGSSGGLNTTPDLTFTTGAANGYFSYGKPNIAIGDLNGDGFDDVIIGSLYTPEISVFLGGTTMNTIVDVTTTNFALYTMWASTDVNHDGYKDLIVGSENTLQVRVYYGGASFNLTADLTFTAPGTGFFIDSVTSAGDVNGDSYEDVIIGTSSDDTVANNSGAAFIYYGGAVTLDTTADVSLYGAAAGDTFGYTIHTAGDVNGDNTDDVIVGAYHNDTAGDNAGAAYIYFGSASGLDATADVTLLGAAVGNKFGVVVTSVGDINDDNYDDIAVVDYNYASYTGRVHIFYGGASVDATADITLTGENSDDYFGGYFSDAVLLADINGDGRQDLLIAASGQGNNNGGALYLYYGDAVSTPTPTPTSTSGSASSTAENENNEFDAFPSPQLLPVTHKTTSTKPIIIKVNTLRPDVERVYAIIGAKKYTLYDDGKHQDGVKGDLIYATNPVKVARSTPFTVSAVYFAQTTTSKGTIIVKAGTSSSLLPHINTLFQAAYHRHPNYEEWKYWADRFSRETKSQNAWQGAMRWRQERE